MLDFLTLRRAWFTIAMGSVEAVDRVRTAAWARPYLCRTMRGALAGEIGPRGAYVLVPGVYTGRVNERGCRVYLLDWDAALDGGTLEPWKP